MKNKGELLAAILCEFSNCYIFLHNTKEQSIAEKILAGGFIFENQLPHSTDRVNPHETIEVTYFLFQRKDYGSYTIIIAIPKPTYEKYTAISNEIDVDIEEIMSASDPWLGDNDELIFRVPEQHILGYFNNKTADFVKNEIWDPDFDVTIKRIPRKRTNSKKKSGNNTEK